jgi:hypothetical protein
MPVIVRKKYFMENSAIKMLNAEDFYSKALFWLLPLLNRGIMSRFSKK